MSPEAPRVLVTGAGGPSAVSILLAMEGAPVTMLAADIDPYGAGLYLVPPERRSILPRGEDPRFADALLDICRREQVDVVVPTVDTELLPLALDRERYAESGVTLVVASEHTLRVCLDKWLLAERCRGVVRVPETAVVDDAFDAAAWALPVIVKPRSGSGSRGIHLLDRREQLAALERDGTLLVQEHLPGTEHSLDVLARADGHVAAVVPRARLKVDSGIAVTGLTLHDERLDTFARETARLIGLTTVANVQVKEDASGEPALLEVNARFPGTMPLTIGSGVDMPRLAIGEALGTPIPDGPLPFRDIAMVRFFQERFFAVEELAELRRESEQVHA
jgi:carbamoyl-phosphate synthase large subunit